MSAVGRGTVVDCRPPKTKAPQERYLAYAAPDRAEMKFEFPTTKIPPLTGLVTDNFLRDSRNDPRDTCAVTFSFPGSYYLH